MNMTKVYIEINLAYISTPSSYKNYTLLERAFKGNPILDLAPANLSRTLLHREKIE
jgi:hypothetical protein